MGWRVFAEAAAFAQSLDLDSSAEWSDFYSSMGVYCFPADIPKHPQLVYKESWEGWGHFLKGQIGQGTKSKAGKSSGVKGLLGKRPRSASPSLSQQPLVKRSKGRKRKASSADGNWKPDRKTRETKRGSKDKRFRSFCSYEEAKVFARSLNFAKSKDWTEWCRERKHEKPDFIPSRPDSVRVLCRGRELYTLVRFHN